MVDSNVSLFEMAVQQYEKLAEQHFKCEKELGASSENVRAKRKAQLDLAKKHLNQQRVVAQCMASIQVKLDEYRAVGRMATEGSRKERALLRKELQMESHHPTILLAKFMLVSNKPKPSSQHAAHHIVPGKGKTKFAYLARVHMLTLGVRINDPDNGVWLPMYKKYVPHWSMPKAKSHLEYHTEKYEYLVSRKVEVQLSEVGLRKTLNQIGLELQKNGFEAGAVL